MAATPCPRLQTWKSIRQAVVSAAWLIRDGTNGQLAIYLPRHTTVRHVRRVGLALTPGRRAVLDEIGMALSLKTTLSQLALTLVETHGDGESELNWNALDGILQSMHVLARDSTDISALFGDFQTALPVLSKTVSMRAACASHY